MNDVATETVEQPEKAPDKPRKYGFSAIISGLTHMWRGTLPALIVIVVNAIAQSILTWWNPQVGLSVAFIAAFILSLVFILWAYSTITRVALDAAEGKVGVSQAFTGARATLGNFTLWAVVRWGVITIGFMLMPIVGGLIMFITPFVPFAAADGRGNAIGANFSAIKDRWGRWLITAIIVTIGVVIFSLLQSFNVFFIKGFPASLIAWLAIGVLGWWVSTAWALIYRSTRVGAATMDTDGE